MSTDHLYIADVKLKADVECTLTREQVMAARAADPGPLTITPARSRQLRGRDVIDYVTSEADLPADWLTRRSRKMHEIRCRSALAWALHDIADLGLSWPEVSKLIGLKDPHNAASRVLDRSPEVCDQIGGLVHQWRQTSSKAAA